MADSRLFVTQASKISPLSYWTLHTLWAMTNYRDLFRNSYCILDSPSASFQAKAGAPQTSTTGQSKTGPLSLSELSPHQTLEMVLAPLRVWNLGSRHHVLQELRVHTPTDTQIQNWPKFVLKLPLHQYGISFYPSHAGIRDTYLVFTQVVFVW